MKKKIKKIFLCLDIGTKYIGCALNTLPNNINSIKILSYIKVIKNKIKYEKLNNIIKYWQPDSIVVGKPKNNQFIFDYVKKMSKLLLIKYSINIIYQCEHLTSWEAKKLFKTDKKLINCYSAKIILKSFLIKK